MTNDEFEETKEFILQQQARFAAGMQQLHESQANTERVVAEAERVVAQSGGTVARIAAGTREGFTNVRAKINTLIDSQIQTEDDLRKLIAFLDRYFGRRRNRNGYR